MERPDHLIEKRKKKATRDQDNENIRKRLRKNSMTC